MAATSEEQINLLLSSFDQIYEVIFAIPVPISCSSLATCSITFCFSIEARENHINLQGKRLISIIIIVFFSMLNRLKEKSGNRDLLNVTDEGSCLTSFVSEFRERVL